MSHVPMPRKWTPSIDRACAGPSPALNMVLLPGLLALLSGCIILDGSALGSSHESGGSHGGESTPGSGSNPGSESGTGMPTPPFHRLPPPAVWRVELPVLDAEGQKRLDEVEQYVAAQYEAVGWQILGTTQTYLGDIYDWLDPASVKGSDKEPPPTPSLEDMQLPDGAQLQLAELDAFTELRGPEGTIPVLRPSFGAYVLGLTGASSLEDFLTSYVVPGDPPSGPDRRYAGIITTAPNRGANVTINSYTAFIELYTMSVLEMVVGCRAYGEMWQQIGIASSRNFTAWGLTQFGDSVLRLEIEFLTAGASQNALGNGKGGWAGKQSFTDFVPAKEAPYGPGAAFAPQTISIVGGPQYESLYQIANVDGDWWVGHNRHWLGYYPGKLFGVGSSNLLASSACEVDWYGEVYDPTPESWTWTDMGSGHLAEERWGNAAYFRAPSYISLDAGGTWTWPNAASKEIKEVFPSLYTPNCYTNTALTVGPSGEPFFYVGGPGREDVSPGEKCE